VSTVTTLPGPVASHSSGVPAEGAWQPRPEASEACPLCAGPLHRDQEWCLRCGAAARTRLAATPNWRIPIAAIVAVIVLSLGVLSAALVDLAGSSSPTKVRVTRTVTTAPAALVPLPASTATTPTTTAPGAAVPGAAKSGAKTTGGTTITGTPATGRTPGAAAPRIGGRTITGPILPTGGSPGTGVSPSR
jgi:hypothetical protein